MAAPSVWLAGCAASAAGWWRRIGAALRPHAVALTVLCAACVAGQLNVALQTPLAVSLPDTHTYLAVTDHILVAHQFFDAWRTPGYPIFLALVFVLTGGQHFGAVVVVQIALLLLTTGEIYMLGFRLAHSRWQACLIAALAGLSPFTVAWEHTITTETLTYWLMVTLFVVFERYLRSARVALLGGMALLLLGIILTRPQYVFLLPLSAVLLAVWRLRTRTTMHLWREIGIMAVLPGVLLLAYCVGNLAATGYFGLSDVSNVSLFGKVIEYQMFDLAGPSTDPRYAQLRAAVHTAEASWQGSLTSQDAWQTEGFVWTFVDTHPQFEAHGRAIYGAYSTAIIERHPLDFLAHTLPDILASAYAAPVYFAAPGYATPANVAFSVPFLFLARLYAFLPLIGVYLVWRLWKHPTDVVALVLLAMVLVLGFNILVGAFTDFAEFWRIRFATDWMMPLVAVISLAALVRGLALALARARGR